MSKDFKIFLIVFLLSLPFWWFVNTVGVRLEKFFYWREITQNPYILTAQANQQILEEKLEGLKPFRRKQIEDLEIDAKSAISVFFDASKNEEKILFEKEIDKKSPIASLTKLMTADIILKKYNLSEEIEISKTAVSRESGFGILKTGEKFLAKDLLHALLIESNNTAAYALSENIGLQEFIKLMNLEAENLGLLNTHFVDPAGLDPENPTGALNSSSARDLAEFAINLLKENSSIWEISSLPDFNLYSSDGIFHHKVLNTNEILAKNSEIIGGKTGETKQADGCLLLVLMAPNGRGVLINIILGSKDRFNQMQELIDWTNSAYRW